MPRKVARSVDLEFAFFTYLWQFYQENRGRIRQHYRDLSRRFLDFNDPANINSFLRQPQFEALEVYIFLKEFLENKPVHQIFKEWMNKEGGFQGRGDAHKQGVQISLLEDSAQKQYEPGFERMRSQARVYPN